MNLSIAIDVGRLTQIIKRPFVGLSPVQIVGIAALILSIVSTTYAYVNDYIVAYGDAESHLNIAKRVVHSITPGIAQLGGIWLPIPHIMIVPFVLFDPLWRSGLAGSIVSGISYIIACLFLFKTTYLITKNYIAAFTAFLVFALNPNILYMQSTPMTELPLIMFFILSTYYFIQFMYDRENVLALIVAAFFGFCATLSRYDGWFLVLFEALIIVLLYIKEKKSWREMEGKTVLFVTLAFFGILLWFAWDFLILGDPFYFTNSQFSAKTQQMNWLERGELPSYHNLPLAFGYYFVTAMSNAGFLIFLTSLAGIFMFIRNKAIANRFLITLLTTVPFIFYIGTLFMGQSVIFIPHLTPIDFEWRLFNVRYGIMVVPVIAFFFAYLFYKRSLAAKLVLIMIFAIQMGFYLIGYSKVITLADGTEGLSHAKRPDAEYWMAKNYDGGLVLIDDYARTMSIIRSGVQMQNIIYIGNKPYWEESFYQPEKHAKWIIMQKDDALWKGIYDKPHIQSRLFAHFQKVYTSPEILIFRRVSN